MSISPTRYTAINDCAMREVWAANHAPALLPSTPAARLGTAVHKLLEEAGNGRFTSGGDDAIAQRWQELVVAAETTMSENWLERHLVPLSIAIADFEVRRIQALERARHLSGKVQMDDSGYARDPGRLLHGFEVAVSSPDGLVRGRIDEVTVSDSQPVIRDYKSGAIFESRSGEAAVVKQAYETQLWMYASLYAQSTGTWPRRLEVVPVLGASKEVTFDADTCDALVREAREALRLVNERIEATDSPSNLEFALANPKPQACMYCAYRPACLPYRTAARQGLGWPCDIWGSLVEMEQLADGRHLLSLRCADGIVSVRGVASELRHPALRTLGAGDDVAIFSLGKTGSSRMFTETPFTVIYRISAASSGSTEPVEGAVP
jgi:RecB family exonuclease